jgi:hypothetical protein
MSYREDLRDDAYVVATFILDELPDDLRRAVTDHVASSAHASTEPSDVVTMHRMVLYALNAEGGPGVLHDSDFFDLWDWEHDR